MTAWSEACTVLYRSNSGIEPYLVIRYEELIPRPRSAIKYLQTGFRNLENGNPWSAVVCSTIKRKITTNDARKLSHTDQMRVIHFNTSHCVTSYISFSQSRPWKSKHGGLTSTSIAEEINRHSWAI
jgi:hypothetical protein